MDSNYRIYITKGIKMNNIEVVGKMNCYKDKWNYINNKENPSFSALILKEKVEKSLYPTYFYNIVSSPFYNKIDEKLFANIGDLKVYYEMIKEKGWIIELDISI